MYAYVHIVVLDTRSQVKAKLNASFKNTYIRMYVAMSDKGQRQTTVKELLLLLLGRQLSYLMSPRVNKDSNECSSSTNMYLYCSCMYMLDYWLCV